MTDFSARPIRRYGNAIAAATVTLVAGAIIMVWSWNAVAVDLFAAPAIDFRHAIATELTVMVLAVTIGLGIRFAAGLRRPGGAVS